MDPEDPENIKEVCQQNHYRTMKGLTCNPEYKQDIDSSKTCLNNPYCGFEEALRTLNCKWLNIHKDKCEKPTNEIKPVCNDHGHYNNHSPKMPDKPWSEMSTTEKNLWRYTIMGYQTERYISDATQAIINMSPEEINEALGMKAESLETTDESLETTKPISSWDKTKIYILRFFCMKGKIQGACMNISYVENITGDKHDKNPSYIDKWNEYKKNNEVKCNQTD